MLEVQPSFPLVGSVARSLDSAPRILIRRVYRGLSLFGLRARTVSPACPRVEIMVLKV